MDVSHPCSCHGRATQSSSDFWEYMSNPSMVVFLPDSFCFPCLIMFAVFGMLLCKNDIKVGFFPKAIKLSQCKFRMMQKFLRKILAFLGE